MIRDKDLSGVSIGKEVLVRQLPASEASARRLLFIQAVEREDPSEIILSREDKQYATATALGSQPLASTASGREKAAFLSRRAECAFDKLVTHHPALSYVEQHGSWPRWLTWTLVLAAFATGLATNSIEGSELNVLAFPILGMLAWNFIIYILLFVSAWRRGFGKSYSSKPHPILAVAGLLGGARSRTFAYHPSLERAVERFERLWAVTAGPLTDHRLRSILHVSAAVFALGTVLGMLARARYTTNYSAGWAGTWAGAESEIAAFLGFILAPASAITGIDLPTLERLQALRGTTENAGDWLILWIVTATLFVIAPRIILALVNAIRASALKGRLLLDENFYFRGLLRNALGGSRTVRLIPYGLQLNDQQEQRLSRLLAQALGENIVLTIEKPVPYGAEDEWLSQDGERLSDADQVILLFNLASTPEAENHGAFAAGVRQHAGDATDLTVLVDESALAQRMRGQPSMERRLEERTRTWNSVLSRSRLEPIRISLDQEDVDDAAFTLEQALLRMTRSG